MSQENVFSPTQAQGEREAAGGSQDADERVASGDRSRAEGAKTNGQRSHKIPKQGAGQYVIFGAPNVGKSRLLSRLTRATPEVAPYPFTTHEPHAGMMDWEDVHVQLIDTPPITADYLENYVQGMIWAADAALLMVDLGDDDGPFAAETVLERSGSDEDASWAAGCRPCPRIRRFITRRRCWRQTRSTCRARWSVSRS